MEVLVKNCLAGSFVFVLKTLRRGRKAYIGILSLPVFFAVAVGLCSSYFLFQMGVFFFSLFCFQFAGKKWSLLVAYLLVLLGEKERSSN